MGLNIIAYRITGIELDEDWSGNPVKIFQTEKHNFDSLRYGGDRDFAAKIDFEAHPESDDNFEHYCRPTDIPKAKQWVRDNIVPGNQPRLLNLLEDMEKDETIYLVFSF